MRDYTQLLPTGSVVYLTNARSPVVIIGLAELMTPDNTTRRVLFDYAGAPYPDGQRDERHMFFNREDIARVIFRGLDDENFRRYLEGVQKNIEQMAGTYELGDIHGKY